ncbi:ABC transporter permease [Vallicoccus soli]|uniref:FtsX-like permease family protein n=1 Tax=Vallicoccus soli TaxID=2339232 RepID=A0A3A3YS95_9ACTN|nr:FtsX-like permease family protein [Vallicoccus soli]RJK93184.1 FtsX-like permease family protein [Vallicoccus soli]
MLRASLRSLLAHKLRLALSAVAVVLGVAFVAGSLVFTSTLSRTFTDLFENIAADVTVTRATSFDQTVVTSSTAGPETGVPEAVLDDVRAVDGVATAVGDVQTDGVFVVDAQGDAVGGTGAPGLGINWDETPGVTVTTLTEGRGPQGPGEIAVDTQTADRADLAVGDRVRLITPAGPREEQLVGVFRFGESGGLAGASLVAFDTATAQSLTGAEGFYSSISVDAEDGVGEEELRDAVAAALPDGFEAKTATEITDEGADALEQSLSFINVFLLVFAGIALFVGSFIILNTFSMIVAQRTRELALLRAVGASRAQVTRSVLVEALAVGLLGAVLGLGVGVGLAALLRWVFGRVGLQLDGDLVVEPSTVVWSFVVGVGVTLLAAYVPARRAARVPPVAAMRDDVAMPERSLRVRLVVGGVLAALGAAALLGGLATDDGSTAAQLVGAGALLLVVGAIALSPVLSRPALRVLGGWYPRAFGAVGRIATENARRNPRRTAATASALMIGLALVASMSVLGASANASVDRLVDEAFGADYVVSNAVATPFSAELAASAREVEGVEAVYEQRFGQAQVDGGTIGLTGIDPGAIGTALTTEFVAGSAAGLEEGGVLLDEGTAESRGLGVGDVVALTPPYGDGRDLEVLGVFTENAGLGEFTVSLSTFDALGYSRQDNFVYVLAEPGADPAAVRAGLDAVVADYPVVDLADQTEFKEDQRAQIDQLLTIIYALLALAVVIAVLGIVNTLALSVIERTREIGLLRAVGMSRRQLRRMVRLESVVIALYGAALGIVLGLVFGISLQRALAGQGIEVLSVPVVTLLLFLVVAAVVGVLAAVWPARRAAKLDVLQAITTT